MKANAVNDLLILLLPRATFVKTQFQKINGTAKTLRHVTKPGSLWGNRCWLAPYGASKISIAHKGIKLSSEN